MHVSVSDSAPGLDNLVSDIARTFSPGVNASSLQPIKMDEWNGMDWPCYIVEGMLKQLTIFTADWDILYPFSQVGFDSLHHGLIRVQELILCSMIPTVPYALHDSTSPCPIRIPLTLGTILHARIHYHNLT